MTRENIVITMDVEWDHKKMGGTDAVEDNIRDSILPTYRMLEHDVKEKIVPDVIREGDIRINQETNTAESTFKVLISKDLIDTESGGVNNLPILLGGDLFVHKHIKSLRTTSLELPKSFFSQFSGPSFGIDQIRKKLKVKNRPLVSVMVSPVFGFGPEQYAKRCHELFTAGADIVSDNQLLVNPRSCPLLKRSRAVFYKLQKLKRENKNGLYSINVNLTKNLPYYINKINDMAHSMDVINYVCVGFNAFVGGISGVEILKDNTNLPIEVHVGLHGVISRFSKYKISLSVFAQLFRLIGGDLVHSQHIESYIGGNSINSIFKDEVKNNYFSLTRNDEPWDSVKKSFPVACVNISPKAIQLNHEFLESQEKLNEFDVVYSALSYVYNHPRGYLAGVKSLRQM
ncbi:MAG TPA: hypothetical protein ENI51_10690, partial [Candidatus Atribacteria bacterium]|nr:hypothetical protein [Candidatus Atribacteria bacterium]